MCIDIKVGDIVRVAEAINAYPPFRTINLIGVVRSLDKDDAEVNLLSNNISKRKACKKYERGERLWFPLACLVVDTSPKWIRLKAAYDEQQRQAEGVRRTVAQVHQDTLSRLTGEPSRTYDGEGVVQRYTDPGFDYIGEVLDKLQARSYWLECRLIGGRPSELAEELEHLKGLLKYCHPKHPQAYLCEACKVLGRWTDEDKAKSDLRFAGAETGRTPSGRGRTKKEGSDA